MLIAATPMFHELSLETNGKFEMHIAYQTAL